MFNRKQHNFDEIKRQFAETKAAWRESWKDKDGREQDKAEWLATMTSKDGQELICERVHWLLIGTYGLGAELNAHFVLADDTLQPHVKAERLLRIIAALEWRVFFSSFVTLWHNADKTKREGLRDAVEKVIESYLTEYLPASEGEIYKPATSLPANRAGHQVGNWLEFNLWSI